MRTARAAAILFRGSSRSSSSTVASAVIIDCRKHRPVLTALGKSRIDRPRRPTLGIDSPSYSSGPFFLPIPACRTARKSLPCRAAPVPRLRRREAISGGEAGVLLRRSTLGPAAARSGGRWASEQPAVHFFASTCSAARGGLAPAPAGRAAASPGAPCAEHPAGTNVASTAVATRLVVIPPVRAPRAGLWCAGGVTARVTGTGEAAAEEGRGSLHAAVAEGGGVVHDRLVVSGLTGFRIPVAGEAGYSRPPGRSCR